jgi:type II secretory pathway pseudopilin PulG
MHRRPKGFTLAELVLALAITTVIGLAVTGVAAAVSNLNQRAEDYFECLQNGRVAAANLETMLRPALLITAASGSSMVVWTDDHIDPGKINVSEVAKIFLDTTTRKLMLRTTAYPGTLTASQITGLDTSINLNDLVSASAATSAPTYVQYEAVSTLACNVQSFAVYPDVPGPLTGLLKFKLVIGIAGQTVTQYGAVTVRAPKTSSVTLQSDGKYALN